MEEQLADEMSQAQEIVKKLSLYYKKKLGWLHPRYQNWSAFCWLSISWIFLLVGLFCSIAGTIRSAKKFLAMYGEADPISFLPKCYCSALYCISCCLVPCHFLMVAQWSCKWRGLVEFHWIQLVDLERYAFISFWVQPHDLLIMPSIPSNEWPKLSTIYCINFASWWYEKSFK